MLSAVGCRRPGYGPFGDLDRTYGALGTWVLERSAGADGPIREHHLPTGDPDDLLAHTTEVCWPVRAVPDDRLS